MRDAGLLLPLAPHPVEPALLAEVVDDVAASFGVKAALQRDFGGGVAYALAIPEAVAREYVEIGDAIIPPEAGVLHGGFAVRDVDGAGSTLFVDGTRNQHIRGVVHAIVETIASEIATRARTEDFDDADEEEGADDEEADDEEAVEDDDEEVDELAFEEWDDLVEWARSTLEVDEEGDGYVVYTQTWNDTERTQQVTIATYGHDGEPWIVIRSKVCRPDQMDPAVALARNEDLAFALLSRGDHFVHLVYSLPLEGLRPRRIARLAHLIASEADDLESEHTGGLDEF